LSTRISVALGKISYPVYLWHWPLLSFLEIIEREKPWWGYRALALIFALALSVLTYKFLEKPLRASAKRKRSAPCLLLMALLIATLSFYVFKHEGIPSRPAVQNSEFSQAVRHQFMGPLWKYEKNDLCNTEYPFPGAEDLAWWFCMKSDDRPPTILLLGNSHANHLYPGFAMNPAFSHHTILSIGTCAVGVDGHRAEARNPCSGERVAQQKKFIDDLLAAEPTIRHIVIGGIRPSGEKKYITRVVDRLEELSRKGYQIIVFRSHLLSDFNPKACFKTPLKKPRADCFFDRSAVLERFADFAPIEAAVKAAVPDALFFDPNDIYCDPAREFCGFRRFNLPLLRDRTHFSEFGSILVQREFTRWAKTEAPSLFKREPL
jgi:hypothetical protein